MIVPVRRRFWVSAAALLTAAIALAGSPGPARAAGGPGSSGGNGVPAAPGAPAYGVGEIVVAYTDYSRHLTVHGRLVPRRLLTLIRYPTAPGSRSADALAAPPARTGGPFPLIVFAHGFNITPAPYAPLLRAWVQAGYVVAAPIFPLSKPAAPGGANEVDLVNQPGDMSFVISRLLAAGAAGHGILAGLLDPGRIAVSGQSDGGSTALAVAYDQHDVDHRIGAAMILSGAEIPGLGGYTFPAPGPPLLAVQGTADTINLPVSTYHFFSLARQPKFLLSLLGAGHLGPYTNQKPQLGIVEAVTVAFLDRYLKRDSGAAARMQVAGKIPRLATLHS